MELVSNLYTTSLVNRLTAQSTCIIFNRFGRLLCYVRLLLQHLLLFLLVIGQNRGIFNCRSHLAPLFLTNDHLWSLIWVLRVSQASKFLLLVAHFGWLATSHGYELTLITELICQHFVGLWSLHALFLKCLGHSLFGPGRVLNYHLLLWGVLLDTFLAMVRNSPIRSSLLLLIVIVWVLLYLGESFLVMHIALLLLLLMVVSLLLG